MRNRAFESSFRSPDCKRLILMTLASYLLFALVSASATASDDCFETVPFAGFVAATCRVAKTPIISLAFQPSGNSFAVIPKSAKSLEIWRMRMVGRKYQLSLQAKIQRHGLNPKCLAWSPDGSSLAVGFANGDHGSLSVFRIPDDSKSAAKKLHDREIEPYWSVGDFVSPIESLGFIEDGVLLTPDQGGNLGAVNVWTIGRRHPVITRLSDSDKIHGFTVAGDQLVAMGEKHIVLYQNRDSQFVEIWKSPVTGLTRCSHSHDGRYIVANATWIGKGGEFDVDALTALCWETANPSAPPVPLQFVKRLSVVAQRQEIRCLVFG